MEDNFERLLINQENEHLRNNNNIPFILVFDNDIMHIKSHFTQFFKTINWKTIFIHIFAHIKNYRYKNKENLNGITFNSIMSHIQNKDRW